MRSFDCTKYNRYGFTGKEQDCANAGTNLCQYCFRSYSSDSTS